VKRISYRSSEPLFQVRVLAGAPEQTTKPSFLRMMVLLFSICPAADAGSGTRRSDAPQPFSRVRGRGKTVFRKCFSGREHLVDLERSEQIYLVIRDHKDK
jgi:hypothetical protein